MKSLFNYQVQALTELNEKLKTLDIIVLGACPNAGKTFMAAEFIKSKPGSSFLILPHGTNVLNDQWEGKLLEEGIPFNKKAFGAEKVTLALPHRLYGKAKVKQEVDYIIIDEAHEFYNGKMVQEVKKVCKPKKTILLTGSHGRFDYPKVVIAPETLIENGNYSDLYFGIATSSEIIKNSYRNDSGELKSSYVFKDTPHSMENLLEAIIKRLRSTVTKSSPILNKLTSWVPVFGLLHKTMIACNSIRQANEVYSYLMDRGVTALISHTGESEDLEQSVFEQFKNVNNYKVLVVVRRGTLGFDMENLVNVVDMTFAHNVDRIFQLYSRVARKSGLFKQKYFFKLCTEDEEASTKYFMTGALLMINKDFYTKFNGKNFLSEMKIPYTRAIGDNSNANTKVPGDYIRGTPVDAWFYGEVSSIKLMMDVMQKKSSDFNEVSWATVDSLMGRLKGIGPSTINKEFAARAKLHKKQGNGKNETRSKVYKELQEFAALRSIKIRTDESKPQDGLCLGTTIDGSQRRAILLERNGKVIGLKLATQEVLGSTYHKISSHIFDAMENKEVLIKTVMSGAPEGFMKRAEKTGFAIRQENLQDFLDQYFA